MLRSVVGMAHVLRSGLVMGYTSPFFGYSQPKTKIWDCLQGVTKIVNQPHQPDYNDKFGINNVKNYTKILLYNYTKILKNYTIRLTVAD